MKLSEARQLFSYYLAHLVLEMTGGEYRVALAEGMDRRTDKDPTTDHMRNSLHEIGLAQDLDLYRRDGDGWAYCTETEDHRQFGETWERWGADNGFPLRWGGRWGDGNHYSWEWEGRK
jgi:hypothetical protein